MTRLPIVDFSTMEKVLLSLGFQSVRQKAATYSIVTLMAEPLPFPIIPGET